MTVWTIESEQLPKPRGVRLAVARDHRSVSFGEVFRGWVDDRSLRTIWSDTLTALPMTAFRWETPGLTESELENSFECVVLDAPGLERPADRAAFAEHDSSAHEGIAVFANLRGDSELIVPTPIDAETNYCHLAAFLRNAPPEQCHSLWRTVGERMLHRLGNRAVWLNTAGGGVAWLHIRLDSRPKYYRFAAYRNADSG